MRKSHVIFKTKMNKKIKNITYLLAMTLLLFSIGTQNKAKIHQITQSNIGQFSKSNSMWLVQISKLPCTDCQKHQKALIQSSQLLEGVVKIAKAPAQLIPQQIQKNPTYLFVGGDIKNIQQYQGSIEKTPLTKFCLQQIQKVVKKRNKQLFGGSSSSETPNSNSQNVKQQSTQKQSPGKGSNTKVMQLNDQSFQKMVLGSKDQAWFVEFYSPTCPHCINLQPEWDKLPKVMGSKVRIAKIDATKHNKMAQKYQVKGFPTLLFFGKTDKSTAVPYNGQRTAESMKQWLQSQDIGQEKRQFLKLTQQIYDKQCNRNIVCLIFLVQKKADKNAVLDFIEEVMQNNKNKPLRFFYANKLNSLQQTLMIEDRQYPKMVSVWDSINSYRVYNKGMNMGQLEQWISKIMQRKAWIRFSEVAKKVIFSQEPQASQL